MNTQNLFATESVKLGFRRVSILLTADCLPVRFFFILMIVMGLQVSHCIAQSEGLVSIEKMPESVQNKFKLLYPEEKNTGWEYEHGGCEAYLKDEIGNDLGVAYFSIEGVLVYSVFKKDGKMFLTEREIKEANFPKSISTHLLKKYRDINIRAAVIQFDSEEKIKGYRIIIKNEQIIYDSEGQMQNIIKIK